MSTFLVYKVKKCLLKSGKITQRFAQLCPTPWAFIPKVVGHKYPCSWSSIPMLMVIRSHVHGLPCSCSRALFQYVLCAGKYRRLHPFYIHVFHSQAFDVLYRCASVCSRKWIGVLIDMGRGAGRTGISCWKI